MAKQKPHWVTVGFIKKLTGWNNEEMRRARENRLVIQERSKNDNGKGIIRYDLNSLRSEFIKNQTLAQ